MCFEPHLLKLIRVAQFLPEKKVVAVRCVLLSVLKPPNSLNIRQYKRKHGIVLSVAAGWLHTHKSKICKGRFALTFRERKTPPALWRSRMGGCLGGGNGYTNPGANSFFYTTNRDVTDCHLTCSRGAHVSYSKKTHCSFNDRRRRKKHVLARGGLNTKTRRTL
jgi:hypothetical protein